MRSFALRFQNRFARAAGAIGVRRGAPELSHLYYWALLANPLWRSFWFFLFHVIVLARRAGALARARGDGGEVSADRRKHGVLHAHDVARRRHPALCRR